MKKVELQKGKYYIGDPIVCFNKTNWEKLKLELRSKNNFVTFDEYVLSGDRVASEEVSFMDDKDNVYLMKSGYLSIIPLELAKVDNLIDEKELNHIGRIVEFYKDFKIKIVDGLFIIDSIEINTKEEKTIYDENF